MRFIKNKIGPFSLSQHSGYQHSSMDADLREYLGPFTQMSTNVPTYSSLTLFHEIKRQQGYSAVKSRKCGNNILLAKENFKGEKLFMLSLINIKNKAQMAVLEECEYIEPLCVHMKRKRARKQ